MRISQACWCTSQSHKIYAWLYRFKDTHISDTSRLDDKHGHLGTLVDDRYERTRANGHRGDAQPRWKRSACYVFHLLQDSCLYEKRLVIQTGRRMHARMVDNRASACGKWIIDDRDCKREYLTSGGTGLQLEGSVVVAGIAHGWHKRLIMTGQWCMPNILSHIALRAS